MFLHRTPTTRPRSHRRIIRRAAAVLVAATLAVGAGAPALAATEPGKFGVTGTVAGSDGSLLEGEVMIWRRTASAWQYVTNDVYLGGQLNLALPPGEYALRVTESTGRFREEYYQDATTIDGGTPVVVSAADVQLNPIVLDLRPALVGRIVDAAGTPVPNLQLAAYQADNQHGGYEAAFTDSTGRFRFHLPAGDVRIAVRDPYGRFATEWFPDAASFSAAGRVSYAATGEHDLGDVVVSRGGSLRGQVSGAGGGPLGQVRVTAYDASGMQVDQGISNSTGRYVLPRLHPGTYTVLFVDNWSEHHQTWLGGASNAGDSTPVTIGPDEGDVTAPDTALAAATRLTPVGADATGRVRDTDGHPVLGAQVTAYRLRQDGQPHSVERAYTDRAGRFWFTALDRASATAFRFEVRETTAVADGDFSYHRAFYGGTSYQNAQPVTIEPGQLTEGIDLTVEAYGGLRGQLVDESGTPVGAAAVSVFDPSGTMVASAMTDADGRWETRQVEGGLPLFVRFVGNGDFVDEWWQDAASLRDARSVSTAPARYATVDARVSRSLAAPAPAITGAPTVGATLTASPGAWNAAYGVATTIEWRRGSTIVGTGSTYVATSADAGTALTVRVVGAHPDLGSGEVTATTATIRHVSTTTITGKVTGKVTGKITGKARKRVLRLTIGVAAGVPASGTVTVADGRKAVRTVTLSGGRATLVLRNPKKGRHHYVATYAGNGSVAPSSGSVAVKVKR